MSVVQVGAQFSLRPCSGLLVWQAVVQALTSQAGPLNCGSVGVGFGVGVGVGFADGEAGPAATACGAKLIVKPTVRQATARRETPEKSASQNATRMAPTGREKRCHLCQKYRRS
jgi:hypothetical protein